MSANEKIIKVRRNPLSINSLPDCYGNHAYTRDCANCFCEYECKEKAGL
jgi:hypothetical protein